MNRILRGTPCPTCGHAESSIWVSSTVEMPPLIPLRGFGLLACRSGLHAWDNAFVMNPGIAQGKLVFLRHRFRLCLRCRALKGVPQ